MKNAYERFVRPLLFSIDPETAHRLTIGSLRAASHVNLALRALSVFQPPAKPKKLFGLNFPNPIGLAAGLDKNGVALPAWAALGFGFIEIGTVTAKAQPGNPKPRIFRLPEQQALINRLGFNNDGADAIAERLGRLRRSGRWPAVPVGINIGKSRATTLEHSSIPRELDEEGGLSGAPLREKSTALVREIAKRSAIPVIASGGISDAESAREKFQAGAQLIQLYTGFIYRGPRLLREIMEA